MNFILLIQTNAPDKLKISKELNIEFPMDNFTVCAMESNVLIGTNGARILNEKVLNWCDSIIYEDYLLSHNFRKLNRMNMYGKSDFGNTKKHKTIDSENTYKSAVIDAVQQFHREGSPSLP